MSPTYGQDADLDFSIVNGCVTWRRVQIGHRPSVDEAHEVQEEDRRGNALVVRHTRTRP